MLLRSADQVKQTTRITFYHANTATDLCKLSCENMPNSDNVEAGDIDESLAVVAVKVT